MDSRMILLTVVLVIVVGTALIGFYQRIMLPRGKHISLSKFLHSSGKK